MRNQIDVHRQGETAPRCPPPWGLGHGWSANGRTHWKNARGSASRTPRAGDPLQGPQFAPFCDTTRCFAKFGESNDLEIRRDKNHYDCTEESFVKEKDSNQNNVGTSRNVPKTKENGAKQR